MVNATDRRFFWLSMYVAPALWVGLAVLALVRLLNAIWLVIVGEFFLVVCSRKTGMERKRTRKAMLTFGQYSYRVDPHNHEHAGFFQM